MTRALVVWQLSDGKRGHERQCEGLIGALAASQPLTAYRLAVATTPLRRLFASAAGGVRGAAELPAPDLLVGAGSACQWPLLAARRAHGGRAIYLMRPALPPAWFDLCVVPRHDRMPASARVIVSDGPLNPMCPATQRDPQLGLFLLGGPSPHHRWDSAGMLAQLSQVMTAHPGITWQVSDSRRSPPELEQALRARADLNFISHRDTAAEWLPRMLAQARHAWISADSVAMIYEALSAGAAVGILTVPAARRDRITAVADDLHVRGMVSTVADLQQSRRVGVPLPALEEARRCAALVLARWPDLCRDVPGT